MENELNLTSLLGAEETEIDPLNTDDSTEINPWADFSSSDELGMTGTSAGDIIGATDLNGAMSTTNADDLFSSFEDDEDDLDVYGEMKAPLTSFKRGTLLKIKTDDGLYETVNNKVFYISSGPLSTLEAMKSFLINAEMSQYTGEEAASIYSTGIIDDARREINSSYLIVEDIEPTEEEIASAVAFNERFKQYTYKTE